MNKILIVAIAAILAAGCQKKVWVKPGATQQSFSADKANCMAQAYQAAPMVNRQVNLGAGTTNPYHTNCNQYGSTINCTTQGGGYTPPPSFA